MCDTQPEGVLNGSRTRLSLRFARKHLEELDASKDLPKHTLLKSHLDKADECFALVDVDWGKCTKEELDKLLKPIVMAKLELPSTLRMKLFVRAAMHECSVKASWSQARLDKLVRMATPWTVEGVDAENFDCFEPKLSAIEGSPIEKASVFIDIMLDKLVCPIVQGGEDGADTLRSITESFLTIYNRPGNLDDTYLTMLARLLTMWRAIIALMSPDSSKHLAELSTMCKAKHDRKLYDHDVLKKLALVMGSAPYYKALLGDFETTCAFTEVHFADIQKFKDILDSDSCAPGDILKAVDLYAKIKGSVRAGLAEGFFTKLISGIEAAKSTFAAAAHADDCIVDGIADWLNLFRSIAKAIPDDECSIAQELTKATKLLRYHALRSKADEVSQHIHTLTEDWLNGASDEDLKSWLVALGLFRQSGIPTLSVDIVVPTLVTFLASTALESDKAQLCIDIAIEILNTPFLTMGDELKKTLQALKASRDLAVALKSSTLR